MIELGKVFLFCDEDIFVFICVFKKFLNINIGLLELCF